MAAVRAVAATVVFLGLVAASGCGADERPAATPSADADAAGNARTLVLYDTTGTYAALGELYAIEVANLVSHFGTWTAHPVSRYAAGEDRGYTAVVYIGSTYDEPLPDAFLDDVAGGQVPVLWLNDNLWQLTARYPTITGRYGFALRGPHPGSVTQVRYRGTALTRNSAAGNVMHIAITDPEKAKPVGEAVLGDGSAVPWGYTRRTSPTSANYR